MSFGSHPRAPRLWYLAAALLLGSAAANAAPNYYSEKSNARVEGRISVGAPKGGTHEPGGKLTISWTKKTAGSEVDIWLYTASGDGIRGDKVDGIVAPASAQGTFTDRGGSFDWVIPDDLEKGRYVIVVSSGLDEATSPSFAITDPPVSLSAPRVAPAGTLKRASVDGKGKGSIQLATDGREVELSWGSGLCPALVAGLPGALVTLAALGGTAIVPVVRDVTKHARVEQTCLDGFVVVAPPRTAAPTTGASATP